MNGFIAYSQYSPMAMVSMMAKGCTASEVVLIFTTQQYQYLSVFCLFPLLSDEPEVFLPKYSQPAMLHVAHFRG